MNWSSHALQVHSLNGVLGPYKRDQTLSNQALVLLVIAGRNAHAQSELWNCEDYPQKLTEGSTVWGNANQQQEPHDYCTLAGSSCSLTHYASYHYLGPGLESKCSGAQTH